MDKRYWRLIVFCSCLLIAPIVSAYTVVTVSTMTTEATETSFLAATTTQFNAVVTKNPLASNTYTLKLYGLNPNYNAPPPPPTTLQQALSLGSTVYLYGWNDGSDYQSFTDDKIANGFFVQCSSPSVFGTYGSTTTWDMTTCQTALNAVYESMFQLHDSSVTTVPGY